MLLLQAAHAARLRPTERPPLRGRKIGVLPADWSAWGAAPAAGLQRRLQRTGPREVRGCLLLRDSPCSEGLTVQAAGLDPGRRRVRLRLLLLLPERRHCADLRMHRRGRRWGQAAWRGARARDRQQQGRRRRLPGVLLLDQLWRRWRRLCVREGKWPVGRHRPRGRRPRAFAGGCSGRWRLRSRAAPCRAVREQLLPQEGSSGRLRRCRDRGPAPGNGWRLWLGGCRLLLLLFPGLPWLLRSWHTRAVVACGHGCKGLWLGFELSLQALQHLLGVLGAHTDLCRHANAPRQLIQRSRHLQQRQFGQHEYNIPAEAGDNGSSPVMHTQGSIATVSYHNKAGIVRPHTCVPLAALPRSSTCSVSAIAASNRLRTSPCCCDSPVMASASACRSPTSHPSVSLSAWSTVCQTCGPA